MSLLSFSPGPGVGQEVQTENVTVAEGGVAEITCRLHQYDGSIVVIQNPARQTLFFNGTRGECWGLDSCVPKGSKLMIWKEERTGGQNCSSCRYKGLNKEGGTLDSWREGGHLEA